MFEISIAEIICNKCGSLMSVHRGENGHRYVTCTECGYIATLDRDATMFCDYVDYLTGEIKVSAEKRQLEKSL